MPAIFEGAAFRLYSGVAFAILAIFVTGRWSPHSLYCKVGEGLKGKGTDWECLMPWGASTVWGRQGGAVPSLVPRVVSLKHA